MQTEEQLVAKKDSKSYEMDKNPIVVTVNTVPSLEKPHYTKHVVRKPSFLEEEARERDTPLITEDAGKVDGKNASTMNMDDEPANIALYDKIILSLSGYALEAGGQPEEDILPERTVTFKGKDVAVRDLIPASHKNTVIRGMFPSDFSVDVDNQDFVFALGGGREWRIKQEIGGKVQQDDGTLSDPDFTVYYTFREPTEIERKNYRSKAMNAVNMSDPKTGKMLERRSTNLRVMRDLFDGLIQGIEGATIEGKEIRVGDKSQIEQIPATFKKGCMVRLFNFLEADLGN